MYIKLSKMYTYVGPSLPSTALIVLIEGSGMITD